MKPNDDAYWTKEAIYARLMEGMEKPPAPPKPLTAQQRADQRWANRPIEALKQDAEKTRVALLQRVVQR
jgi:hypothetical protein